MPRGRCNSDVPIKVRFLYKMLAKTPKFQCLEDLFVWRLATFLPIKSGRGLLLERGHLLEYGIKICDILKCCALSFVLFHHLLINAPSFISFGQGVAPASKIMLGELLLQTLSEPCHEKTCLCHMRRTKAQISLHIPKL